MKRKSTFVLGIIAIVLVGFLALVVYYVNVVMYERQEARRDEIVASLAVSLGDENNEYHVPENPLAVAGEDRLLANEYGNEIGAESQLETSDSSRPVLTCIGRIEISSINLAMPLWSMAREDDLRYGAGIMPLGAYPGENGNCVIFGHRMSRDGSLFNRLGDIKEDDLIQLTNLNDTTFIYYVHEVKVIEPSDLGEFIAPNMAPNHPRVTLVTCTPTGVGSHRLIIIADMVSMA